MKTIIAGNWKLNLTVAESLTLASSLATQLKAAEDANEVDTAKTDVVIAPTALALYPVAEMMRGTPIAVSGQNSHFEAEGAFTGENSPAHLQAAGARYCIVGHSERRQLFGETDENVARKTKALIHTGLTPIVCVGETLAEREADLTMTVVSRQLLSVLETLAEDEVGLIVLAYEPVWAIGTGRTATPAQAQEVHANLRDVIARHSSSIMADRLRIQYGGSVKPANAAELLSQPDINGALVGGASMKAESFMDIIKAT